MTNILEKIEDKIDGTLLDILYLLLIFITFGFSILIIDYSHFKDLKHSILPFGSINIIEFCYGPEWQKRNNKIINCNTSDDDSESSSSWDSF